METQPEPTLVEFVLYNRWANQQLLAICMNLDESLLTAGIPGAYGSIRETFGHLLRAEAGFLKRIHGTFPQPAFQWEEGPSLAQMATYAAQVGEAFMDTLQRVPPTQNVHEEENGLTFDYQARQLFMSVVYHGIAHRTDITTFLNGRGVALPELDVWGYLSAYPERFEVKKGGW
ncbi:MAG: DinB family protein [Chloroflexi bacterium]|nr:DinB family protein [Chloroflexota bacterium]MCL5274979.1 DinB family protein [Chloroflexota bacterium]